LALFGDHPEQRFGHLLEIHGRQALQADMTEERIVKAVECFPKAVPNSGSQLGRIGHEKCQGVEAVPFLQDRVEKQQSVLVLPMVHAAPPVSAWPSRSERFSFST